MRALIDQLRKESDFGTRYQIWEDVQRNFYTEVPMIKIGDANVVTALATQVGGFVPMTQITVAFWNLWLEP